MISVRRLFPSFAFALLLAAAGDAFSQTNEMKILERPDLPRAAVRNGGFYTPDGKRLKFWGVNAVSFFPDAETARCTAANLKQCGVNLVRLHHLMRPSQDWVWNAPCSSLALYQTDSRTPDDEAWNRFDLFNHELAANGIRIVLSMHFSRKFMPGDSKILPGEDAGEWEKAISEINSWDWKKSIDPVKLLPVIDERCRMIQKEFTKNLLSRKNIYSGITYGQNPQVLYIEMLNESSFEYAVICGNRFPEYFERRIQSAWEKYAEEHGRNDPGSFFNPASQEMRRMRSNFFRSVEDAYFEDMRSFVKALAPELPVVCGNLWRGNDFLAAVAEYGDIVEDHFYVSPLSTVSEQFWFDNTIRTRVAGKPYVIGELNMSENPDVIKREGYARPMLMLSAAAYGAFHDIDGILWFAWNHGDRAVGRNGWSKNETGEPSIGDMVSDSVVLDHMAACSELYRNGAVSSAENTAALNVAVPQNAGNYNTLMSDSVSLPPGSASVRAYAKKFTASPDVPTSHDKQTTQKIFTSDTGQIIRDTDRGTLTVKAPACEAFSGELYNGAFSAFTHIGSSVTSGFSTVILVSMDGKHLSGSSRMLISRTMKSQSSSLFFPITISNLDPVPDGYARKLRILRPRIAAEVLSGLTGSCDIPLSAGTSAELPQSVWTQAEIITEKE